MRRFGKKTKEWLKFRRRWIKNHPPNFQGYYSCYLCGRWIKQNEMELEHMESKSRAPEKSLDEHNLRPSCHNCNSSKGSRSVEEFLNDR
jgi:5-methylcytosine-specific restriction endonuclease McrA